jgi:hypothetical protein
VHEHTILSAWSSHVEGSPCCPGTVGDNIAAAVQVPSNVPSGVGSMINAPEDTGKMYNPYAGLRHVGTGVHPAFRISSQPEFVFQEDASIRRRGFGENLAYYTGAGYLSGAVGGGAVGLAQGISNKPEGVPMTRRLLLNRLLNSTGQTGRMVGADSPLRASLSATSSRARK